MDNKFESLQELIDSIEIGLDIECFICGIRYYIGHSGINGKRVIAVCPDGHSAYFDTLDEMLSYEINGKPLKEIWSEIEIYSM